MRTSHFRPRTRFWLWHLAGAVFLIASVFSTLHRDATATLVFVLIAYISYLNAAAVE